MVPLCCSIQDHDDRILELSRLLQGQRQQHEASEKRRREVEKELAAWRSTGLGPDDVGEALREAEARVAEAEERRKEAEERLGEVEAQLLAQVRGGGWRRSGGRGQVRGHAVLGMWLMAICRCALFAERGGVRPQVAARGAGRGQCGGGGGAVAGARAGAGAGGAFGRGGGAAEGVGGEGEGYS